MRRAEDRYEIDGDRVIADDRRQPVAASECGEQIELGPLEPARQVEDDVTDLVAQVIVVAHRHGGGHEHVVVVGAIAGRASVRAIQIDHLRRAAATRRERGQLASGERA